MGFRWVQGHSLYKRYRKHCWLSAAEGFIPTYDATVVARLKEAGAILVGKTRLPAFSMGGNTPSHNPWDLSRTPGGSSGALLWPWLRAS